MVSFKIFPPKASKYSWWDESTSKLRHMLNFPDELESYNKIVRTVKSCKNSKQLKTTNVMVDKFYQLYSNAIATEALNKLILLKNQSFRLTHL